MLMKKDFNPLKLARKITGITVECKYNLPIKQMNRESEKLTESFNGIVRPARAGDLPAIMVVENSCFGSERYDDQTMDEYIQTSLAGRRTTFLLAFENATADAKGEAAGYVLGDMDDDETGHIIGVAVMEQLRDRHLGGILVDRVCDSLRQAGAQRIMLEVRKENAPAIHLYEKHGFVRSDELAGYYGPGEDGIEMTLECGPAPA